jgi:hypothetical protein
MLVFKEMYQRVFSVIYILLIVAWFYNITVCVSWLLPRFDYLSKLQLPKMVVMCLLCLIAYKVFSSNTKVGVAYQDWFSDAAYHTDKELHTRYNFIKQQRQEGNKRILLTPLSHHVSTINFGVEIYDSKIHLKPFLLYWQMDSVGLEK